MSELRMSKLKLSLISIKIKKKDVILTQSEYVVSLR